ncbi:ArnT family glycosyltransferase [Brevibacillus choshinensis]|uniref:Glycosyltransferase family 39 protein n=1 Tax=Brevibacillus choshinensis TaxID=54911 RepID=A0ABX7FWH2_BRECH|nr:glycosyltransferase family 39 protein [Brevibacillus choshinensis]QRG70280.1 glycosyltransferase family 39 protein [Brevibacillus choshinensis]
MVNKQLRFTHLKPTLRWLSNDWVISFILFLFAFIIRIPYLYDVPRFIDEWREIGLAAQIARGQAWPLHNTSHDIGPFHNYVLAGLFTLFGFDVYIPRLYVTVTSAATVVVTFWLGRHWAGRITAVFAALLLATNSMHILITHMAWSNDTTPFFVGLAVLVSLKAMDQERRSLWALAGLAWAIALQTHPSVIAALLGVVFYFARQLGWGAFYRDARLRIGIAVLIVGYSNMIIHNFIKPLDSVLWVKRKGYALNQEWSIQGYFQNMLEMGSELIHSLASAFPDGKGWLHGISSFLMLFFIIGLLDGFRRLCRFRNGSFVVAIVISSFLVIPILNDQYKFYIWTRYIAYLFPLCFVTVAIGFQGWIRYLADRDQTRQLRSGLAVAWVLLLILPLHHFYQYAETYIQSGVDNSAEFFTVQTLQPRLTKDSIIVVDKQAKQAEAVSKMLRVKGFRSPLEGVDPNEVREVQAVPSNGGEGIDATYYSRWKKALALHKDHTWYVLSLENKDKLTSLFGITWTKGEVIRGGSGKQIYFVGRISSYEY